MKIIVGLGNPGTKYLTTRHNIGFLCLDYLIKDLKITWKEEKKLKAATAKITHNDEILYLVKPLTFMNLSGQAVSAVLSFFKQTPQDLTVIYDDVDLPFQEIRIRDKGSAGTHNGMKSIIQELGTQEFRRIRLGIESRGQYAPAQQDLSSFVLNNFSQEEMDLLPNIFTEAIKEI